MFFFSFACRETVFLQTPMGPEAPLLKHTLKFGVEEGHFSCLWSTANSQSCPRIVIGGLQRVAKDMVIAPVILVQMENTPVVAGGWS